MDQHKATPPHQTRLGEEQDLLPFLLQGLKRRSVRPEVSKGDPGAGDGPSDPVRAAEDGRIGELLRECDEEWSRL